MSANNETDEVRRLKINERERRRMHDLNSAMDGLRGAMPYARGPNVRKLSKIASILLARNYMLQLQMQIDELKQALRDEQCKNETYRVGLMLKAADHQQQAQRTSPGNRSPTSSTSSSTSSSTTSKKVDFSSILSLSS